MSPWRPSLIYPENSYLCIEPPAYITGRISQVHMCTYTANPNMNGAATQINLIANRPIAVVGMGNDELYGFEGGTGSRQDTTSAWGLMGFVLKRYLAGGAGAYDIHIVFRGSRSGSAARAAYQGLSVIRAVTGNSDWITDMDFNTVVQDPEISHAGSLCRGFKTSMHTCLSSIRAILSHIGGVPQQIYVTGHSLGGALAAHFTSAATHGTWGGWNGANHPGNVNNWPWSTLKLITFSAPTVGGETFHKSFNMQVDGRRVWCSGDPITQSKRNFHVGAEVELDSAGMLTANHEVFNVRRKLLTLLQRRGTGLGDIPVAYLVAHPGETWRDLGRSFLGAYNAMSPLQKLALRDMLRPFNAEWGEFVTVWTQVIADNSAHRTFNRQSKLHSQQHAINTGTANRGTTNMLTVADARRALSFRVGMLFEAHSAETACFLGLGLILCEFVQNPQLTIDNLATDRTLLRCLSV
jgi:hypothetical protein